METEATVYVVDDDPGVRKALGLFCKSKGLTCEAYPSAFHFLAEYDPSKPGCLLLDIRMPEVDGLELQKKLIEKQISIPIIIISGHANVSTAVEAMKLGAFDVIEKPFRNPVLLETINRALRKDMQIRQEGEALAQIRDYYSKLTERERQVIQGLYKGLPNKAIATEIGVSHKTVEYHRKNMMEKMQVNSLAELIQKMGPLFNSTPKGNS
jgi:two-component system, LuxR family, response regulator FixJ